MSELLFFLAAIAAIVGAVGVATLRNAFYAVLALVVHLVALAMLFLLLRAEFVAAAQVVVYAGAVMVLYVFVVSYVGGTSQPLADAMSKPLRGVTVAFALGLFAVLAVAVVGSGLTLLDSEGAGQAVTTGDSARHAFGTPGQIGELLLTDFLLPFELASFLLLVAAVGAVTLARRRGGLETASELSVLTPLDVVRPRDLGSMAEGVGTAKELTTGEQPPAQPAEGLRT